MNETIGINWRPETRRLADLTHWDKNPRKASDAAFEKLKERIRTRGFHGVIKIDTHDVVLSGNLSMEALVALSIEVVTVLVPDRELTEDERDKVALESNLHDGKWDYDMLSNIDTPTLLDIGFTEIQLGLKAGAEEPTDTRQTVNCPHCNGGIRLSNRVKKIEKI